MSRVCAAALVTLVLPTRRAIQTASVRDSQPLVIHLFRCADREMMRRGIGATGKGNICSACSRCFKLCSGKC